MSIVLVTFPAAPKVSHEAIQKELELEKMLEKKVRCEYKLFMLSFLVKLLVTSVDILESNCHRSF